MAAARVFATPELVEGILLRLPTRDLLFSKRISRTCRNVHDSKKIKRALFLIPGTALDTSDEASFPQPGYSASEKNVKSWWSSGGHVVPLPKTAKHGVSFKPLLVAHFPGPNLTVQSDRNRCRNSVSLRVPHRCDQDNEQASFRRMYITQPPLHVLTVIANDYHYVSRLFHPVDRDTLKRLIGGMIYGDLLDEANMILKYEGQMSGEDAEDLWQLRVSLKSVPKGEELEEALEALTL